jgi:MFS family permease
VTYIVLRLVSLDTLNYNYVSMRAIHSFHHTYKIHWTEMRELFASLSLQAFGYSMVKVFLPVYFLILGMSLQQVALWFMFLNVLQIISHELTRRTISTIGVKHSLTLSYVLSVVGFILISVSYKNWPVVAPGFILYSLGEVLYWDSRNCQSANVLPNKTAGKQVGLIFVLIAVGMALGPFFGGLVGQRYGLAATMLLAAVIIVLAAVPLFMTGDDKFRLQQAKTNKKIPIRHLIANGAFNFENGIAEDLWPVFIFLIIGDLASMGALVSVGLIASIAITMLAGTLTDKGHSRSLLRGGSFMRALSHALRVLVNTFGSAFAVNALGELARSLKTTPFASTFYANARIYGIQHYIKHMETAASLGYFMVWALLYVLLFFLEVKLALIVAFVVAVFVSPIQILLVNSKKSDS